MTRPIHVRRRTGAALGVFLACSPLFSVAQQAATPQPFIEQQRQQERERALREQNERSVDERLPTAPAPPATRIPDTESPCFRIDSVRLVGEQADSFQWAITDLAGVDEADSPIGRCLGTAGVNVVLSRAQAALIARGWVTTRVLVAPQDLSAGSLTLTLVPGRIAAIRLTPESTVPLLGSAALLGSAIPASPGDLLNLRAIEQGLENLKRVPTAEADLQIEPSTSPDARPGDSDLVVRYVQAKKWRVSFSLDDSGTRATGRHQAGATLSVDNPLGLNDLFYVNASHSLNFRSLSHLLSETTHGTEAQTVHYSLPHGHWLLGFTASNSRYHQSVAGLSQDYIYAGKTNNAEIKLSRLIYRDQSRKTTVAVRAFRRESRNFIDDTQIDVQHRVVGGWEASLNHKEFFGLLGDTATLEGTLAYKRGTGGLGAIAAPEEAFGEGTSRLELTTADLTLNAPFKLGGQKLRYAGLFSAQWNRTPLTPQDRFAIGGRYTVRGFDGETSLLGDRGALVRNDIGWAIPSQNGPSGAELYVGVDHGQVGGRSTGGLQGRRLTGAVFGVRGQWRQTSYDFFMGTPISKPEGYRTASVTAGFSLISSF